jgi:hypothetical protein
MFIKGGMTGLPEDDFGKRMKSGEWSIDEHFENVNYIRTRDFTPNNYLAIGSYQGDELVIYDMFLNKKTTLTKSITSLSSGSSGDTVEENPTITCMSFNRHANHLAIGLNKPPYLRVFDTWPGNIDEMLFSGKYIEVSVYVPHPVYVQRFRYLNLDSNTLHIAHNLEDSLPLVGMLTSSKYISYPYEISIIDENNIDIIFINPPESISGMIYVHSFSDHSVHSVSELPCGSSENYGQEYIYHRLDITEKECKSPVFQVYALTTGSSGETNNLIFPSAIYEIEEDKVYDFLFPVNYNTSDVLILVGQGFEPYSEIFLPNPDLSPVVINHKLDSKYLFYQFFDTVTGRVIYPNNIHIQDKNNILVSSEYLLQNRNYKINIVNAPPESGISEFLVANPPKSPVFTLQYDNYGDRLFVGTLEVDDNNNYLLEYETENYTRQLDLTPIYGERLNLEALEALPTTISIDQENKYVFVGHYMTAKINSPIYQILTESISKNTLDANYRKIIYHYFNNEKIALSSIDTDDFVLCYPDEMKIVNSRRVDYIFNQPSNPFNQLGCIYSYSKSKVYSLEDLSTESVDNYIDYILNIQEEGNQYPVFQIYDVSNNAIIPTEIIEVTAGQIYKFRFPNNLSPIGIKILLIEGILKYSETFSMPSLESGQIQARKIINHNLNSRYLFIQLTNLLDNCVVMSYDIEILDENSIAVNLPPLLNFKISIISVIVESEGISRNVTVYDYNTRCILNEENLYNMKQFTIDSLTCSIVFNQYNLFVFGSYYTPYLYFYNFLNKQDVTEKYTNIIGSDIISRVTNLVKTNDEKYLLIAIDQSPYLFILDLETETINRLTSELFVSSFTSLSFSINDRYLCVTQREEPYLTVFEFTPTSLTPVILNYTQTKVPISSTFFMGPISSEA